MDEVRNWLFRNFSQDSASGPDKLQLQESDNRNPSLALFCSSQQSVTELDLYLSHVLVFLGPFLLLIFLLLLTLLNIITITIYILRNRTQPHSLCHVSCVSFPSSSLSPHLKKLCKNLKTATLTLTSPPLLMCWSLTAPVLLLLVFLLFLGLHLVKEWPVLLRQRAWVQSEPCQLELIQGHQLLPSHWGLLYEWPAHTVSGCGSVAWLPERGAVLAPRSVHYTRETWQEAGQAVFHFLGWAKHLHLD